jgi:GSCFA family
MAPWSCGKSGTTRVSNRHPYVGKPDYQFWRHEPGIKAPGLFDPITRVSFTIGRRDPVVTAGSCFAQHVARHLAHSGFNYLVTEQAHPLIPRDVATRFHYGTFTARYGNVYTARQLKQLLQRAWGQFAPQEDHWKTGDGLYVDPFRPQIHDRGFASLAELQADRERHFSAIRTAIESMRVFVFTLGLTETWSDFRDGAVFPLAPGVAGGTFDEKLHGFVNFDCDTVVDDMQWCFDFIRARNPSVKLLLTVSPVPLNATAEDRHVFVATTYSKSVLRIAAERLCQTNPFCDYFPSYEIITSPYARGAYFGPDCREVTEAGVEHVMSVFLRHYGGAEGSRAAQVREPDDSDLARAHAEVMEGMMDVLCDEERIDNR